MTSKGAAVSLKDPERRLTALSKTSKVVGGQELGEILQRVKREWQEVFESCAFGDIRF